MLKKSEYQGWANYSTWIVALWLDNEESTYNMVQGWVTELRGAESEQVKKGIWTAEDALKFNLADRIQEFFEENNPMADEATVYSDLMRAALAEVDWREVAEHYIDKDEEAQSFKDPLFGEGKEPARDLPAADDIQLKGGSLMAAIDRMGKTAATKNNPYWLGVSLDINLHNILLLPFSGEGAAERMREDLSNATDYTVFSVDVYGHAPEAEVREYFEGSGNNKVEVKEFRPTIPWSVKEIYDALAKGTDLEKVPEVVGSLLAAIEGMGKAAGTYEDEFVAALRKKFPAAGDTVVSDAYDLVDLQDAQHDGLSPQAVVDSLGQDATGKIVWAAKTAAPKKKTKKPTPKVKTPEAPAAPAPEAAPVEPTPVSFDEDTVQAEMAKELETEADDLTVEDSHMSSFGVTVYTVKDGQQEYSVVASEDEAEALAKAVVRQDLENEPENFNKDFIKSHISLSDTDCRMIAQDLVGDYYQEMKGYDLEKEYERETHNDEDEFPKDADGENDHEKMREELEELKSDEYEKSLQSDPYGFLVDDQGIYDEDSFFKQFGHNIDLDAATDEAVATDGWEHFLSRYDGNSDTTPAGFVYWRDN